MTLPQGPPESHPHSLPFQAGSELGGAKEVSTSAQCEVAMQRPGTRWPPGRGPAAAGPALPTPPQALAGEGVGWGQGHIWFLPPQKAKTSGRCSLLNFLKKILCSFRERGREEERERNINWLPLARPPTGGPSLQPRPVPRPGIKPGSFCFAGRCHQLSHAGQGFAQFLLNNHVYSPDCIPGTALGTVTDEETETRESQQGAQGHR